MQAAYPHSSVPSLPWNEQNDFDFLWTSSYDVNEFLPASFFDTEHSLADLWQNGAQEPANISFTFPTPQSNQSVHDRAITASPGPNYSLPGRLPPEEPEFVVSNSRRLPTSKINVSRQAHPNEVPAPAPWNITTSTYRSISESIAGFRSVLPDDFIMPSRHTLSRYIEGYFGGFHEHLPFLHPATLSPEMLAPELVLSLAAAGAFHRFEHAKGYKLFFASKALIMHKLNRRGQSRTGHLSHHSSDYATLGAATASSGSSLGDKGPQRSANPAAHRGSRDELQIIQALVITIELTSWADAPVVHEALSLASQLAMLVREAGISKSDEIAVGTEWSEWIEREEWRRTLFVAYVLFGLHSIAFNLPPIIANHEIGLCLPHCNSEWRATTSTEWRKLRQQYGHDERHFQEALEDLIQGEEVHKKGPLSAFGNCVLMYALIQQISVEKQTLGRVAKRSLAIQSEWVKSFELALQNWQRSWEATEESCLDPSSPNGTLGFDSAALLRLAYIRLNFDSKLQNTLLLGDPKLIAEAFSKASADPLTRSSHLDRAVLQCMHAFSIPVRVGVAFIARTQTLNWSIQHSLCNLEGAFLLSAWFNCMAALVASSGAESLREDERKLLSIIISLIKETDLADTLERNDSDADCIRRMGVTVTRLWAETFKGVHVFQVVHTIGEALSLVSSDLESRQSPR